MRPRKQLARDRAATKKAEHDLEVVRARWAEVHRAVAALRRLRRENHFAASINAALGDGRKGST